MGADAISVVAIGLLLLFGYVVVVATVLGRKVLRDGGEVEVEVKAPSLLSVRLKAMGGKEETRQVSPDHQHGRNSQ